MLDDGLLHERLEAFYQKNINDITAFAERENRPAEEIRLKVAEWHARYLFTTNQQASWQTDTKGIVENVLKATSSTLESLYSVAGYHSFFLVVHPTYDDDFLGGTVLGREFWRGLRSGGAVGAKAFKQKSVESLHANLTQQLVAPIPVAPNIPVLPMVNAHTNNLKADLYARMRQALRTVTGNRQAEMKWAKPERLHTYGVKVVGWPEDIEFKNPSQMTVKEKSKLLGLLDSKQLYFERLDVGSSAQPSSGSQGATPASPTNDMKSQAPEEAESTSSPWDFVDESLRVDESTNAAPAGTSSGGPPAANVVVEPAVDVGPARPQSNIATASRPSIPPTPPVPVTLNRFQNPQSSFQPGPVWSDYPSAWTNLSADTMTNPDPQSRQKKRLRESVE